MNRIDYWIDRARECRISGESVKCLIEKSFQVGFFGILACASVPNPLFDLAGITCGTVAIIDIIDAKNLVM